MPDRARIDLTERPSDGGLVDVAAILAGGLDNGPQTTALARDDGISLFYPGAVNWIFGEPECGKTWIALATVQEVAKAGRRCAVIDLDHNGAAGILTHLIALGATEEYLSDRALFRLYEPDDEADILIAVADLVDWRAALVVVDSIGELLPMFRASSNSPDDFTTANRQALVPLARAGACVLAIDHVPKADGATAPTGTAAKTRAVSGVSLRVTLRQQFIPGRGGAAGLTVYKDRHGHLRSRCPSSSEAGKGQRAGIFTLDPGPRGSLIWNVKAPVMAQEDPVAALVALLDADRFPVTSRDGSIRKAEELVKTRGWNYSRENVRAAQNARIDRDGMPV